MKCVIVHHSVCGNTYLLGNEFAKALRSLGHEVSFYRVADPDWVEKPDVSPEEKKILADMRALSEAKPDHLKDADVIIVGSPTYFGNVTAEMKTFMDSTGGLWIKGLLAGKRFAAFATAGNPEGGADLCLQAIVTWGLYMGMLPVPVPVPMCQGVSMTAAGVVHYSKGKYAANPDPALAGLVGRFAAHLTKKTF